jgi:hypothetical protein
MEEAVRMAAAETEEGNINKRDPNVAMLTAANDDSNSNRGSGGNDDNGGGGDSVGGKKIQSTKN